jgi:hypothetical protein
VNGSAEVGRAAFEIHFQTCPADYHGEAVPCCACQYGEVNAQ